MAADGQFDPNFVINLQTQYAQIFNIAMEVGSGAIGVEVGTRFIRFYYDRARKLWQLDPAADNIEQIHLAVGDRAQVEAEQQQPQATPPSGDSERRSAFGNFANTTRQLVSPFNVVVDTPELSHPQPQQQQQQQQQQAQEQQQLRPLQPTVALQKQRIEIG